MIAEKKIFPIISIPWPTGFSEEHFQTTQRPTKGAAERAPADALR